MSVVDDRRYMSRALELARRGEGWVEPNPMVGCVLVRAGAVVGEGWHQRYGGPHAEVEALTAAGNAARGATAYVTLEPCCHTGKTPPCTRALIAAGVDRVVVGCRDPNPVVDGGGLNALTAAGIQVQCGVLANESADLVAPFAKLVVRRRPWIVAKWAMTLDGKLATHTGDSRWISGEASRAIVHAIRGRVDAIVVGRRTVEADDPLLTARPTGPRLATRVVLDAKATLAIESRLVRTAREAPVLVAAGPDAPAIACQALRELGVEVWQARAASRDERWDELVAELGRRQMTNVLVEGGAELLAGLFAQDEVDEVHAFVAPRILGGAAPSLGNARGHAAVADALQLSAVQVDRVGDDAYIRGRIRRLPVAK